MSLYTCPECGYAYDESAGDDHQGFPAGTRWTQLPEDFVCPDCAICYKEDFSSADEEQA